MIILILGANSDVAHAVARKFAAAEHADMYLASQNMELLSKKAMDLHARYGVKAETLYFNALDYTSHHDFYAGLDPKPDVVLVAFGYLGDQISAQKNFIELQKITAVNFLGAASIFEIIAADFENRKTGCIIGISSVAGDRGRQRNYIYGSAKNAFTTYLSGLRNRLSKHNVHVMTVIPGFVRTKMTENMKLPEKLTAEPAAVAADIYKAYKKKKEVVYTKWVWKWIMRVIKLIPEKLFKKLDL